ncbi:MAG: SAM-dependent DNA methyltransferase [Chloroflexi bacterium]|nr:SAM-dependent DNA methyltransferase [Chloroflexota bacterium]
MENHNGSELYVRIKQELVDTGYVGSLIQEDYAFADILSSEYAVESIPLAAFAQDPPSYRNACFGIVMSNGKAGPPLVTGCRSLGAPQVFEVRHDHIVRWKMTASGKPQPLEQVAARDVPAMFNQHRSEWSPVRILRAKSAGFGADAQLDFFDLGLLPLLEQQARKKLDRLLQQTIASSIQEFEKHAKFTDNDYPSLYRLLFRLIAAKVLADRGHPGDWINDDPKSTIDAVQDFYSKATIPEAVLDHGQTQSVAWESIKNAFHFQNLSVDTLAYVYENTLVAKETRRLFGIHSTPPEIAEYITRQLPFEDLHVDERRVFEPFAGHAVFLVAAMQRLRDLLPTEMTPAERHRYFVKMLSGIEIDEFAREVARLSLMLADYPNPDGWRLYRDDALNSPLFDRELAAARIVLCNPPFENFDVNESSIYHGLPSVRKPATILHKVLDSAPDMLGFVLPRSFVKGNGYRGVRSRIGQTYSSIEVISLPDQVFRHSDAEAVLVVASKTSEVSRKIRNGVVERQDLGNFYFNHQPSKVWETQFNPSATTFLDSIWSPELRGVWESAVNLGCLGDVADIHSGIEYNVPFGANESRLISETRRHGFGIGLRSVRDSVEPFLIRNTVYLNISQEWMRGQAYKRPWGQQKLVVNKARRSRGPWRIVASIDYQGIVCYRNFHGVWPKDGMSLETLAAILNGPIANAYVATRETGRDIQIRTLKQIPVPELDAQQDKTICGLVRQYLHSRQQSMSEEVTQEESDSICHRLLSLIDAEVLRAYDLSPRSERSLLDFFTGQNRPGPVEFLRYFPAEFKPHLPWHRYISEEMNYASAASTLGRLPVIDDPLVSDAIRDL